MYRIGICLNERIDSEPVIDESGKVKMASGSRVWHRQISQEQNRQGVLEFIATEKVVTIESLLEQFPGFRWGDLLSLLGVFRQEGLVSVQQVEGVLAVRINDSIKRGTEGERLRNFHCEYPKKIRQHLTRS